MPKRTGRIGCQASIAQGRRGVFKDYKHGGGMDREFLPCGETKG
jgi:hypothetical protein